MLLKSLIKVFFNFSRYFPRRLLQGILGLAFCLIFLSSCANESARDDPSNRQVCFQRHCFDVEIVQEEEEVRRGLQFRAFLPEDEGMLFVFPTSGQRNFWMKDTLIPLDMIWMDYRRKVVTIAHNALPCPEDPCPVYVSNENALYVLEINGGLAKRLGVEVGDIAEFKL